MTIEQIKEMVAGSEYDFLRTNPHLKDRIIFLTLGGSYSYGTNVETSDVDSRPWAAYLWKVRCWSLRAPSGLQERRSSQATPRYTRWRRTAFA